LAARNYSDFDLEVKRAGPVYEARVIRSPEGESQESQNLGAPSGNLDLGEFLNRIGRPNRSLTRDACRAGPSDTDLSDTVRNFGRSLFEWVFVGHIGEMYRASRPSDPRLAGL
jgi:hypothetical protein